MTFDKQVEEAKKKEIKIKNNKRCCVYNFRYYLFSNIGCYVSNRKK